MADSGTGSARVSYREQQVVARADLTSEQQYLIAARRRHNIGPHLWGIVFGLEVQVAGGVVSITAGSAVDGYGRELILAENIDVPPSALLELNADRVALWLIYDRVDRVVPFAGEWNCAPGAENRTIERVRLRLTTVDVGGTINPRQPPEVTTTDRDFAPQEDSPDDPAVLWPVFLGLVERAGGSPWQLNVAYEGQKPYAGLRGQTITAASGIARVRAGHEVEGDNRAFAVEIGAAGSLTERLSIDLEGGIFFAEKTTVLPRDTGHPADGNLQIRRAVPDVTAIRRAGLAGCEESGVETRPRFWGMRFDRIAPPKVATPWHVYHAGVPAQPPPEPPVVPFDELRIEFLDPGKKANRKGNRFVIGTRNALGEFVRCVTIDAECTVTVNGTLEVKDQVVMGPVQADPFDARLQSLILGGWLHGMLENTRQLATHYDARIAMALTAPPQAFVDTPFALNVTVTNTGSIPLAGIHVTENHNLSTAEATLPAAFTLVPHEEKNVEVSYTISAPGHFTCEIGVTALAQGGSYEVNASGRAGLEIVHQASIQSEVEVPAHAVIGTVQYFVAVKNTGQDVLSRVFLTTAVDDGMHVTAEDVLTDSFLQKTERRRFDREARRDTPGSLTIKAESGGSGAGSNNGDTATAQKTVVFHTAATFTVSILSFGPGTSNNPMPFTVRVRNTSPEPVTLEHVTLAKSGTSPTGTFAPMVASSGQTIAPNQNLDLPATFTPGQVTSTTNLDITAEVGVTGTGGDVVVHTSAPATTAVS